MTLICDIKPQLLMATNLGVYNKAKHIETDWHFVKEKIESSNIVTNFVSSNDSDVCI